MTSSSCGARQGSSCAPTERGLQGSVWPVVSARTSVASSGMRLADWLVVVGAAFFVVTDFVYLGVTRYSTGSTWASWSWTHDAELWWWTSYWTSLVHLSGGVRVWVEVAGVDLFLHVCTVLCVVAAVLALRRGLGGATVSAGLVRTLGIIAAVGVVLATVWWAVLSPGDQQVALSELAQLGGAVLIIVGANRTQPAGEQSKAARWYAPGERPS